MCFDDWFKCKLCRQQVSLKKIKENPFYRCGKCNYNTCGACSEPLLKSREVVEKPVEVKKPQWIEHKPVQKKKVQKSYPKVNCDDCSKEMIKYFSKAHRYWNRNDSQFSE